MDAWNAALAVHDVEATLDAGARWTHAPATPAGVTPSRMGAVDARGFAWTLAWGCACALLYAMGRAIGTSERRLRAFAVALLLLGVVEALWGIAHRDGGRTGLAAKVAYLGSATGSFVNRGHLGAFLLLAVGAGWGLSAALFPLLPDEVRRHMRRTRRSSQPPGVLEASGDRIPRLAVLGIAASVLAMGLVASRARAPILALALVGLAAGVWAWRRRGERWHLGLAVALPSAGAVMAVAAWGPRGAFGRFLGALSSEDVSLAARGSLWRESLAAWVDAPLFGHGWGAWNTAWVLHERGPHLYAYGHAHSEPVEVLVEGGVLGLLGVGLLAWTWLARTLTGLARIEGHGLQPSVALGLAVGVVATGLQCLVDFPLRTPGVLVVWALCAGVVHGAVAETHVDAGEGARGRWRAAYAALALVAVVCGGLLARMDAARGETRAERVGEVHPVWYEDADEARARDAARRDPLNPWTHLALARALAKRAESEAASSGGAPERVAWGAEQALARAWTLRPRDPRLDLASAQVLLRVGARATLREAWRARAVERLARAVASDPWRADDAFALAAGSRPEQLVRIGDPAPHADPRARARVLYALGRALERAGDPSGALDALSRAVAADAGLGPAHFARSGLLRASGDETGAEAALRTFLVARDRPRGMEGWALALLGEHEAARQRFEEVLSHDARNAWAVEGLAHVARARGDTNAEIAALRRWAALAPGVEGVRLRLDEVERRRDRRAR
jgi:O-antigen ligase/tetratricopeptide (TPR) repeat protein